ncbi:hypothetical protein BDZ45DRAFT_546956, partial [Acephala macrosclerotiorum]
PTKIANTDEANSPVPKKRGRKPGITNKPKEQKTIEESMNGVDNENDKEQDGVEESMDGIENDKDVEEQIIAKESEATAEENGEGEQNGEGKGKGKEGGDDAEKDDKPNGVKKGEKNAFDEVKADAGEVKEAAKQEQDEKSEVINKDKNSVIEDAKREAEIPSSILEKGLIYLFFRGRVGVEDPQGIEDLARSYIVLRPLPLGARLGEGPLEDSGNARLLVLPKKMLPKSHRDRFLIFVEKSGAFIKDLREHFAGNEYATKTTGTSKTPPACPFAEGVYAITSTGRESHLACQIAVPSSIGTIGKDVGLHEKGSFVLSVKNPNAPGPPYVTLDNPVQYPESIQKKFRNLRWAPLEPGMLDYDRTQILFIGEGMGEFGKAVEEQEKDKKDPEKENPSEEMEQLEEEDDARVEKLKEDDSVFADLGLSAKEYHRLQVTW